MPTVNLGATFAGEFNGYSFLQELVSDRVPDGFTTIWQSGQFLGAHAPSGMVRVRNGRFNRHYAPWNQGQFPLNASIGSSGSHDPWQAYWSPRSAWETLPNVAQVDIKKDKKNAKGVASATITVDNIVARPLGTGHTFHRGLMSPLLGFVNEGHAGQPDMTPLQDEQNATLGPVTAPTTDLPWYGVLKKKMQIDVWEGFGANQVRTFTGLIDDIDMTSRPDKIIITARSFGQTLTDEDLFGNNVDPALPDTITFIDRQDAASDPNKSDDWILVDDISDIIKVVLRWAGFQEWEVESTGTRLPKPLVFNVSNYYMDVIDQVAQGIGFTFFMKDPTRADLSLGVPVFRYPQVVTRNIQPVTTITDRQLLTAIDVKETDEPLAYIIRTRSRDLSGGGVSYTYSPPWRGTAPAFQDSALAGLLKHVIHIDPLLKTTRDCKMAALFIALQEALAEYAVKAEAPTHPGLDLDEHAILKDLGTGITSRLAVDTQETTHVFGEKAEWKMTITGPLIDVPDVQGVVDEINIATGVTVSERFRWDASGLVLADGDPVTSIPDLMSNGYDLGVAGGFPTPVYHTLVANGLGGVKFDASLGTLLVNAGAALAPPFACFLVFEAEAPVSGGYEGLGADDLGSTGAYLSAGCFDWYDNATGTDTSDPSTAPFAPVLYSVVVGTGGITVYKNGVQVGHHDGSPDNWHPTDLGNNAFGQATNMMFFEERGYTGAITSSARSAIEAELMSKWGI